MFKHWGSGCSWKEKSLQGVEGVTCVEIWGLIMYSLSTTWSLSPCFFFVFYRYLFQTCDLDWVCSSSEDISCTLNMVKMKKKKNQSIKQTTMGWTHCPTLIRFSWFFTKQNFWLNYFLLLETNSLIDSFCGLTFIWWCDLKKNSPVTNCNRCTWYV